ncbi:MAG TPA: F0F1 ATP synthase subunit B [Actinomycetota bacterium]|nr:F0F1 ATP synthase subunit B [Actinomycetota bacterium]
MLSIEGKTIVLAAEEEHSETESATVEHEPTGLDLILPALPELIGGALAFLVVFAVLKKKAFPKIKEGIEARENAIRSDLESAESKHREAEQVLQAYQAQVADARTEANRIIEEARVQAEQVRKDIVAKAERDAQAITSRAEESISAERGRALQELQGTIAGISVELASKVVGRTLDPASQKDLVDNYIKELSTMNTNGGSAS